MPVVILKPQTDWVGAMLIKEDDPATVLNRPMTFDVETLTDSEAASEISRLRSMVADLKREGSAEMVRAMKEERNWLIREVIRLTERVAALGGEDRAAAILIERITRRRAIDVEGA